MRQYQYNTSVTAELMTQKEAEAKLGHSVHNPTNSDLGYLVCYKDTLRWEWLPSDTFTQMLNSKSIMVVDSVKDEVNCSLEAISRIKERISTTHKRWAIDKLLVPRIYKINKYLRAIINNIETLNEQIK